MNTGATISLTVILTLAVGLQAMSLYGLYGLFRDREMKH